MVNKYPKLNTNKNLFDQVVKPANLHTAWAKVRSNRGAAGGDFVTIEQYEQKLQRNLSQLRDDILLGTYVPKPLRQLKISKPDGGERPLAIPSVSDRVLQTSIANALSPILEKEFDADSFGYRPNRSLDMAVARIQSLRRGGYRWTVEADIVKCFERIPHEPLIDELTRHLDAWEGGEQVLELIALWLEASGQELGTPNCGLPQGSPLSPILANLYLDQLDEQFEIGNVEIVRFADDFVMLAKSETQAYEALAKADEMLSNMGLELRTERLLVKNYDDEFEFLGHLFMRSFALRKEKGESYALASEISLEKANAEPDVEIDEGREAAGDYAQSARILYVMEDDRKLRSYNQAIYVETQGGALVLQVPFSRVSRVVLGPKVDTDTEFIRDCAANEIEVIFETRQGEAYAYFPFDHNDRAGLQFAQAQHCADPELSLQLAKKLVDSRLRNQRARLQVLNRARKNPEIVKACKDISYFIRKMKYATSIDSLRGFEGRASAIYWPALASCLDEPIENFKRTRPARDPFNATINYLTAMLARDVRVAIWQAGLHEGFGALHRAADYKEACVYDLMEPFRAVYTEGLAVMLFNRKHLTPDMFRRVDEGIYMDTQARRAIILGYESLMERVIKSKHSGRKMAARMRLREEARALAKYVRNPEKHDYQPSLQDY